jgi:hypothetical protein
MSVVKEKATDARALRALYRVSEEFRTPLLRTSKTSKLWN